ncbi:MAG: hypothetical protein AB1489_07195 [Acidobacteriota bacterium]
MADYDERIIFHGSPWGQDKAEPVADMSIGKLPKLSEEQLALATHFQVTPDDMAHLLATTQQRNEEQIRRTHHLLHLIDRILAKHHPGVKCKTLFSYGGKAYKMMLQKRRGRQHLEYFTSDLIEDLLEEGKADGLLILEGIIAGAVKKL